MNLHLTKNVKRLVNRFDAVNKDYIDRIKYKTATGIIPNNVMTDHIFFTFSTAKAFASGKIIICEMLVERLADEWIATSSPMFATEWHGFHKFLRGSSIMTLFSRSPTRGWTRKSSSQLYRTTLTIKFNRNLIMLLIMLYELYIK